MLKQDLVSTSTMPAPASNCGHCGLEERRLLHNVRYRGIFRRLCTSCVLRHHPQSFCPTCFTVYHPAPPPTGPKDAVTCFKCYSSSHLYCVGPNPPSQYVCPICVSPNSPIFILPKAKDFKLPDGSSVNNENCRVIDKKAAKILLAAAKISAVSMSNAVLAARAEGERKVKEAAFTRRRAREALEHVMQLTAKEKMKASVAAPLASSGGGIVGSVNNRLGNLSGSVVARVGSLPERHRVGNGERMDSSNDMAAEFNKVELTEKVKLEGIKPESIPSGEAPVAMDVDDNNASRVASGSNTRSSITQDHNNDTPMHPEKQIAQGDMFNNGVVPAAISHLMQGVESNHSGDREHSDHTMPQQQ